MWDLNSEEFKRKCAKDREKASAIGESNAFEAIDATGDTVCFPGGILETAACYATNAADTAREQGVSADVALRAFFETLNRYYKITHKRKR